MRLKFRIIPIAALGLLCACGEKPAPGPSTATEGTTAAAVAGSTADSDSGSGGIVIQAAPGGARPDQFCTPQWSIRNDTGQDIDQAVRHMARGAP